MLEIGQQMPVFNVINQDGQVLTQQDMLGKKTVIYFYPKDNTPGCTAEACDLRDNYQRFLSLGYQVFGVSKDSADSHVRFRDKFQLPFPLLSDPTTQMMQAFGAWGEKKNYGKVSMGTLRSTFVFNEQGVLIYRVTKVDTKNHTAQLLKD
ncbi:MAG: peroxiredoxin [Paludibacteraceae bacterium]|nr:peroxiredoxin [Paludibacteraceae bacterium]